MFDARVRAVLGPTNTGKTHLAITRMLAHASGIIGFPLRLLARENYDRMVAQKGEKLVALITGEEKIVPEGARWFACTVEAMPLDRRAEFVAVDEIQLCADPDRGHVFTDRLLNARGMVETMFLGAETIRPLLQRLIPQAEIETRPRLSQLTYAGPVKLTRLPPRSAVVAFSAGEVYAIAEAIRRRRGGCAVVMGRLSPRTRNAQVRLYQDREVDFLVATDAIGMGLNMDVDHVAFASLQKFDGHVARPLNAQEAAQIAGRAGRGMRDGTFGTTAESAPLADDVVEKIETHRFEALETLAWRNSDLDFTSVDALLDSLAVPPPTPGLARGNDATDHITLNALAREAEVRELARGRARTKLLWEACQVPDFRKLADETHQALCGRIFRHLAEDGVLPEEWVAGQIGTLGSVEGDLDTLMSRLAAIRVWSYVAARNDWLRDAPRFQDSARAAEDAVSDALHERLTTRFVDKRAAHLLRRLEEGSEEELLSAVTRRGEVVVEGHSVGRVAGFLFHPDATAESEEERKLVLRAARRALREEMPRRVAALETAKDDVFALSPTHRLLWTAPGQDPAEVARLRPGSEPAKPAVEVLPSEFLDNVQRERVRLRLTAYVEAVVARELGAIAAVEAKAEADGALRGPAYLLRESLGLTPGATEADIPQDVRQKLKAIGVRAGRYALFVPEALKPRAMALRAQLWAMARNIEVPDLPPPGLISLPLRPPAEGEAASAPFNWPPGFALAMGWLPTGPTLLRLDIAERIAGELAHLTRRAPAVPPEGLASRLGVKGDTLGAALAGLGFRLLEPPPLREDEYGPPAPVRLAQLRPAAFQGGPRGAPAWAANGAGRRELRDPDGRGQGAERRERRGTELPPDMYGPPMPTELVARARRADGGPRQADRVRFALDPGMFGPPVPPEVAGRLLGRSRDRGPRRDRSEVPADPRMFGPPVPPELAPRRRDQGPGRHGRPHAGGDARHHDGAPRPRGPNLLERPRGPALDGPRGPNLLERPGGPAPDRPRPNLLERPGGPGPERPRGPNLLERARGPNLLEARRGGTPDGPGPRPSRDDARRVGPPRDPIIARPPAGPAGPDPDNPFSVLAKLKLRP